MRVSELPRALEARYDTVGSAVPDPDRRNAAVALILRNPSPAHDPPVQQCSFLAIRRARSPRDPWSGQMALPGGALEAGDASLLHTAIRETQEETGLQLGAGPSPSGLPTASAPPVLGRIGCLRPEMSQAPAITIWPFVLTAPAPASARAASPEVASVHWFPVRALADGANRGTYLWRREGVSYRFPCVRIDGQVIWGLTYRVLMRFLEVVASIPRARSSSR